MKKEVNLKIFPKSGHLPEASYSYLPNRATSCESKTPTEALLNKDKVLEFVQSHPGAYLRQIGRELNVANGVVQYHLYTLEKERKIKSRRTGFYKRFYPYLLFGEHEQEILEVLSNQTQRDLLLYLIFNPRANQKELAEFTKIAPSSVHWHMKKLIQSRLVQAKREGQFVKYDLLSGPDEVFKLLQSYHPSIWQKWTDRLADTLDEL